MFNNIFRFPVINTLQNVEQRVTQSVPQTTQPSEKPLENVKLQCIVCNDTFDIYTTHECLFRNNDEEFTLKLHSK